jgi:hypothetical protein
MTDQHAPPASDFSQITTPRQRARPGGFEDEALDQLEVLAARATADELVISLATVKDHVHNILAKTGLTSRSALAAAWREPDQTA